MKKSKVADAIQTLHDFCDEQNACCDCPFGYDNEISSRVVCLLSNRPSEYTNESIMEYLGNFDEENIT